MTGNSSKYQAKEILGDSRYDLLDDIVEDIHKRYVRIPEKEIKAVNNKFKEVMSQFEATMKEVDTTFNDIFRKFTYTGSFYVGLKISNADEYDVNVIIKPTLKMKPLRKNRQCSPGYIPIEVVMDNNCSAKPYKNWLHRDDSSNRYFLKMDAIKSWLQGVVTKAKKQIEEKKRIRGCEVRIRQSGPAWTLVLKFSERQVDIDLVPCLEFSNKEWPLSQRKSEKLLKSKDTEPWYAVPKGPRTPPEDPSKYKLWEYGWRLSFPIQETRIMNDHQYLKYTVRLIKHVRDQLKIYSVASYYIKTLFLLEIESQQDKTIWEKGRRGRLFLYMLTLFEEALTKKSIPFFWEKECNLIGHISFKELENHTGRLKNFNNEIKKLVSKEDKKGLQDFLEGKLCKTTEIISLGSSLIDLQAKDEDSGLSEPIHVQAVEETEKPREWEESELNHTETEKSASPALLKPRDESTTSSRETLSQSDSPPRSVQDVTEWKTTCSPTVKVLQLSGQKPKVIDEADEFEVYGKYVSLKLRSLKGNQAIFAQKLISDVIFKGEMEALTGDFKVVNCADKHMC